MRPGTCTLAIAVNRSHIRICNAMLRSDTVEPLIKDTLNKGHNINNLRTKDKFQCTKWRLSFSSNTLLTSDKGQPLNKRDKMARKQWVPNVSVDLVIIYNTRVRVFLTHYVAS